MKIECNADLDHPCDAACDEFGDPAPCAKCAAYMKESLEEAAREYKKMTLAERNPEKYREEMIDAGREYLLLDNRDVDIWEIQNDE